MRPVIFLLAALLLGGCATAKSETHSPAPVAVSATLFVKNQNWERVTILLNGFTLARLESGQSKCIKLPAGAQGQRIEMRHLRDRSLYTDDLNLHSEPHWQMEVQEHFEVSPVTLRPARKACH